MKTSSLAFALITSNAPIAAGRPWQPPAAHTITLQQQVAQPAEETMLPAGNYGVRIADGATLPFTACANGKLSSTSEGCRRQRHGGRADSRVHAGRLRHRWQLSR
ncbi:hypothetical protein [Chitinolyticbacter meiyuanensis]|uniref:hypothetical protein n=1 Tax=Chitinolyticbacter meiyuanensis TaxID=682798 RepID=UPI0011E59B95|nr:hypothetical protein [Chitinolyticbacter meiyuanensis]